MSDVRIETFADGIAICGDATLSEVRDYVGSTIGLVGLIICDPPYGNVLDVQWDRVLIDDAAYAGWMIGWTQLWTECMLPRAAMYVWGGIGKPGFRPFMRYLIEAEQPGSFELANLITWSKKRGYGVQHNYLFTREECAYFVKGDAKRPRKFDVPYLTTKRGYPGYDKKHPAKSEYYRRTNVWTDVTELLRGKKNPAQKQQRLHEIMIEVHTSPGDWVIDPFAGAGTTAHACRKLGRKFVVVERDENEFTKMTEGLR